MKRFLTALSPQAEFVIVLLGAFALPAARSLLVATNLIDAPVVDDAALWRLLVVELATLALLITFLRMRGWTAERFGLQTPTIEDAINGFGLLAVAYLIPAGIWLLVPPGLKETAFANQVGFAPGGVSMLPAAVVSMVNPIFEEAFVVGYVFAVLNGPNRFAAINVSVALRLLYHLYQGPNAVIFILPMALLFAWWFSGSRRLWPLILAHAALDMIGIAQHVAP